MSHKAHFIVKNANGDLITLCGRGKAHVGREMCKVCMRKLVTQKKDEVKK